MYRRQVLSKAHVNRAALSAWLCTAPHYAFATLLLHHFKSCLLSTAWELIAFHCTEPPSSWATDGTGKPHRQQVIPTGSHLPTSPGTHRTAPSQPLTALSPPDHLCTDNRILQSWFWLGEDGSSSRSCLLSSSACPAGCPACTCAPSLPDRCNRQPWALQDRITPLAWGKANPSPGQHCGWQSKCITCFGVADMTGLFEDMSRCQGVLHQQGCVGHYWFWLGQQVLGDLGHS